ncbi:MAG: lipoate--protein ligase [Lachnospiraceae bacterium]|nr:lipoate--protein ligase [Lachnospiraceae bacterium]
MIKQISSILSSSFNPYENLALEKYLFNHVKEDEVILYLWQNERTVVCGRNQNLWKECHVSRLLEDGGYPVRRLSGGGAVFHDKGNLNFTFLVKKDNYDVARQLQVIIQACKNLGIHAEKTGRNDITVDGRKFSGNAFYSSGERKYHHGTLLIQVDTSMMSAYLNVDKEKLATKGVSSVRSRVANLVEFCPGLTIQTMKDAMSAAFETVYHLPAAPYQLPASASHELEETRQFFSSDEWLYGRKIDFAYRINRRFPWGDFDLQLNVEKGVIVAAALYSDANDESFIRSIQEKLEGISFTYTELKALVESCCQTQEHGAMAQDINELLYDSI